MCGKRKIFAILLNIIIICSLVIEPVVVYADFASDFGEWLDESANKYNFTWSGMFKLLESSEPYAKPVYSALMATLSALGAYVPGANAAKGFVSSFKEFVETVSPLDAGTVATMNTETNKIEFTEDFMNLLKEYLDSLKDSSGKYPADNGIQGCEFIWVKTNTNRNVWQKYYEDYESLYDDAHVEKVGDYDSFLKRFSDYFALSPIVFGGISLHPSEPGMLFVIPDRDGKIFIHTECCRSYAKLDKTVWFYYVGSVTAADEWEIDSRYVSEEPIYTPAGFRRSVNENGKLNDFNYVSQTVKTYWCRNSYMVYNAQDCGSYYYIDSVGTPDGSYIRLFRTDDDAVAYYNATQGCNLPSYPYAGGNVTIINGDVNYGDPDKPLNPDGPGGENPGTGDYGGWLQKIYNKLCEIKDQLFIGNVISALDLLNDIFNNYIKKAGAVVSAVTETASNKFPFCIPVVVVACFKLMDSPAPPSVPSSEKYYQETGGGGGTHADPSNPFGGITAVDVTFTGTAPVFTVPLEFKSLNVSYNFVMDFTLPMWASIRAVIYYFIYFYVLFFLINITLKLVAAMKEG